MKTKRKNSLEDPTFLYGGPYTYRDYLNFRLDELVEIINGKLFRMTPAPNSYHQEISMNLIKSLLPYLDEKPCRIFHAPFDVVLPLNNEKDIDSTTVVLPDLCIICDLVKIKKNACFGAPDLVVEILSPHTSKKDLDLKYSIYEDAGVKEYWLVFPDAAVIEVFQLVKDTFQRIYVFDKHDVLQSALFEDIKIDLSKVLTGSTYLN